MSPMRTEAVPPPISAPGSLDVHGAVISLQDLIMQRYNARLIEYALQRRSVAGISGLHLSKMRGRGIDFEEFRPYQAGDDIRTIDWRVTARTGTPHTKVFREERERPVIVAVDQSASMFFGSRHAFKSVIAAQAAAIFAWLAVDNGDRVGGLVHSDGLHTLVKPRRSRRSALHLLNEIQRYNSALAEPDRQRLARREATGAAGLANALNQMRRITKPGSTLYLISDFSSIDDAGMQFLNQISRHNNVVCCFVYDELEETLPLPGYYGITDGQESGTLNTFDRKARETYHQLFTRRYEALRDDLNRLKIPMLTLRTDQSVLERIQSWTQTL